MKRILIITAILLSTLPAVMGRRVMTLQQCVDSALLNNGLVKAASLEIEKAGILKGTAFDVPKTGITLKQTPADGGGPDNGVTFSQDFEFPTVYLEKSKVLTARENIERSNYNIVVNDLKYEVVSLYHTLLYQRELLNLNERLDEMYDRFCKLATVRYDEGDCSALEKMNAVRMLERNRQERTGLLQDFNTGSEKMRFLTGCNEVIEPSETPLVPIAQLVDSLSFSFDHTPQGLLADSQIALSDRNIVLSRHELLPDIYLAATVQALIKSFNPYHIDRTRFEQGNFMGFEVGISVPLFFGSQRSKIKAAETDLNIARLKKETDAMEAENRFNTLLAELEKATRQLGYFTGTALGQADEIKRLAEVSYEYGEIDYMEYMNNLETFYSIHKEYLDAVNEYNQTVLRINHLIGQQ